jgi:hypothetical protein
MKKFTYLILILMFPGCEKAEEIWHSNQYVFLEQHEHEQSELLEGECHHLAFDFPTYYFDSSAGVLSDFGGNVTMDKSLKMVLGTGASAGGDASSGAATILRGINELPDEDAKFTITKIEANGTVYFSYKDSAMILQPNEDWVSTVTEITEQLDWNGDTLGVIKFTYTDRITNWGLLDKKDFVETSEND